jgi:hypothetical protein
VEPVVKVRLTDGTKPKTKTDGKSWTMDIAPSTYTKTQSTGTDNQWPGFIDDERGTVYYPIVR